MAGRQAEGIIAELCGAWRVMAAILLGMCVGAIPAYSIGAFVMPMADDMDWAVTEVVVWSLTYAMGVVAASPFVGILADRFGARRVALGGLLLLSAVLFATSQMPRSLLLLYASGFGVGIASVGTSAIPYGRVIAGIFDRGLGTAFGLMSCGIGLAALIGPRLMQATIDSESWRTAFLVAGLLPLLAAPLIWFWLNPAPRVRGTGTHAAPMQQTGHTLACAIRLPVFWVLAAGTVIYGVCAGGVTVNLIPYLTSAGFSRADAAGALGLLGVSTIAGRFGTGIIIDRFQLNAGLFMMGALLLQSLSFLVLAFAPGSFALLAIMVYGLTLGAEADCVAYATAKLFGRRFFGSIFAIVGHAMLFIGTGIGPVLFSLTRDFGGSYMISLQVWAMLGLAALPLFLIIARAIASGRTLALAGRPV